MNTVQKHLLIAGNIIIDVTVLDQVTKYLARGLATPIELIPGIFSLRYLENTGIAFSLPLEGGFLQMITVLLIILVVSLSIQHRVYEKLLPTIFVAFILGGAVGNGIDRFLYSYVVDFISVGTFPVFNIADSFVTVGAVGLIYYYWKKEKEEIQKLEN